MATVIEFGGERLELMPQRAIWWEAQRSVIVADLHLGKGAAFRSAGVPVPAGDSARTLERLSALLQATGASRLVILGDFLHAKSGRHEQVLEAIHRWRLRHAEVRMLLVRGNHDRSAGHVPADWDISQVEEPCDDESLVFSHVPRDINGRGVLAGHVHPVFSVRDFDRSIFRAACFVVDPCCVILPSFGGFTGGFGVDSKPGRKIYLVSTERVVKLPPDQTQPLGIGSI